MKWLEHPNDPAEGFLRQALDDAARRTGDEVARRRIWTRISAPAVELPRRRPWVLTVVTGVAIAAGAVGAWLVWPTPRIAPMVAQPAPAAAPIVDVPALNAIPDPPVARPTPRRLVQGPSLVRTGARERAKLTLASGAEADLGSNSVLAVDANDRPAIQRGRVTLSVPERRVGEPLVVTAAQYRIVVLGTRFHVRVAGESVGVDVDEGTVQIWRGDDAVQVGAGESWTSPSREKAAARPVRAKRPAPRTVAARPTAASTEVASSFVAGPPAPALATVVSPPPRPASALAPAPVTAPEAAAAEQFREAQAALGDGRPERALELFLSLSRGYGPTAENASYEVGRVYRDHLGRPGLAVAAWQRYRQRFPRGLLRAETDISILETLATTGDRAGALAEAEAFLDRHPHSERRVEVTRLAERLRAAGL